MATIVTRAGKGAALTHTEGDSNFTNLNTNKLENLVEDTTPQLGGSLDVNSQSIVSASMVILQSLPMAQAISYWMDCIGHKWMALQTRY